MNAFHIIVHYKGFRSNVKGWGEEMNLHLIMAIHIFTDSLDKEEVKDKSFGNFRSPYSEMNYGVLYSYSLREDQGY